MVSIILYARLREGNLLPYKIPKILSERILNFPLFEVFGGQGDFFQKAPLKKDKAPPCNLPTFLKKAGRVVEKVVLGLNFWNFGGILIRVKSGFDL